MTLYARPNMPGESQVGTCPECRCTAPVAHGRFDEHINKTAGGLCRGEGARAREAWTPTIVMFRLRNVTKKQYHEIKNEWRSYLANEAAAGRYSGEYAGAVFTRYKKKKGGLQ